MPETPDPVAEPGATSGLLGREFSTAVVMFHEAVATRLGLTATESKAMDRLVRGSSMTAGELARALRLSPGAITGLVDRLVRTGYVERVADPSDRRRTLVVVRLERLANHMEFCFGPLARDVDALLSRYDEREVAAIGDFMTRAVRTLQDHTARITGESR